MMNKIILLSLLISTQAFAWEGYDDSGNGIEIEKGNLVRKGKEIEYYDYGSGDYKQGEVQSIRNRGSRTELEILDNETGEYKTFDMKK